MPPADRTLNSQAPENHLRGPIATFLPRKGYTRLKPQLKPDAFGCDSFLVPHAGQNYFEFLIYPLTT